MSTLMLRCAGSRMKAATSSSSDSAIADARPAIRTWPLAPALNGRHVVLEAVHREHHRARMLEHRQAGGRRGDAAALAHQQRRAEGSLELRDALADGRRLDVLLLGGALDVAVVAHRDQQRSVLRSTFFMPR
jgi:hypothetical protein